MILIHHEAISSDKQAIVVGPKCTNLESLGVETWDLSS